MRSWDWESNYIYNRRCQKYPRHFVPILRRNGSTQTKTSFMPFVTLLNWSNTRFAFFDSCFSLREKTSQTWGTSRHWFFLALMWEWHQKMSINRERRSFLWPLVETIILKTIFCKKKLLNADAFIFLTKKSFLVLWLEMVWAVHLQYFNGKDTDWIEIIEWKQKLKPKKVSNGRGMRRFLTPSLFWAN